MKKNKCYKYIKREIINQKNDLKLNRCCDSVVEYQIIDRIDGMISLAKELGLINKKKLKKLDKMNRKNEDIVVNS